MLFLFGDAMRIIAAIVGLGQQFSALSQDPDSNATGFVANMPADAFACHAGISHLRQDLSSTPTNRWLYQNASGEPQYYPPDRIRLAISVVEVLELTTGFGAPHRGDGLRAGSERFAAVHEQLGSAFPSQSWRGSASQSYAEQHADQQARGREMADLDDQLAASVAYLADQINNARVAFGVLKELLTGAVIYDEILFAEQFNIFEGTSPTTAEAFANIAAIYGLVAAVKMVGFVATNSITVAVGANELTNQYRSLTDGYRGSTNGSTTRTWEPVPNRPDVDQAPERSWGQRSRSAAPASVTRVHAQPVRACPTSHRSGPHAPIAGRC